MDYVIDFVVYLLTSLGHLPFITEYILYFLCYSFMQNAKSCLLFLQALKDCLQIGYQFVIGLVDENIITYPPPSTFPGDDKTYLKSAKWCFSIIIMLRFSFFTSFSLISRRSFRRVLSRKLYFL